MQRNDTVKEGAPRSRRRSEQLQQIGGSWRHNSIALNSRGSLVVPEDLEKAAETSSDAPFKVISFYRLYKFATWIDIIAIAFGLIMASFNGLCIPLGTILYGEFTALLIDRTVPGLNSTPTITLAWFGGGRILNNGTEAERKSALIEDSIAFGVGCAVLSLCQWIVGLASVDLLNYTALRQIEKIREKFLKSILRQDIAWYDTNTSVNFASRVSEDLEKYREGIGEKVSIFTYLLMSFITSVIISLVYGWELTLVILSCAPVIIGTTALVAKVQSSLTGQELKSYSIAGSVAEEVLGAIRTVVAFGGEEKEISRYSERLEPAKKTGRKKGVYSGVGSGVMWLIIYASYALAFWYGVKLILEDRPKEDPVYTPAVLMIVFFSVLAGAQNLGLTSPHLEAFASARASAASIFEVMERKPPIDSLSEEGTKPNLLGDIQFTDVYFKYPARPDVKILQGLDLTIKHGETVALVGPSGCGKSTVIQLIQRLYDPESGSVRLAGHDLRNVNVRHLRQQIAVVGQEPVLFAGSIKDNIRFGNPGCSDEDIELAAKAAYCHNFIKKLPDGYDTVIGERGSQLSGGQKQRIAIARALIRHPTLLLLDEATSALDSHSEAKVQRALDAASSGRTTVMVSHRLATVLNVDKIVFVDKGQVVESGTHKELMEAQGRYYQMVSDNEAAVAAAQPPGGPKTARKKLKKMESIDSVLSVKSSSSSSSEEEEEVEERKKEQEYNVSTWRILKMNAPETVYLIVGVLAAVIVGASFPAFAVLFGETYGVLASKDDEYVMRETEVIAILFMLVGVITGIGIFFQIYMFNVAGVNLTARLRVATFSCMLRQEMAWFDDSKNAIGALTGRLAGDAAAVQGATGTRIGALVQAGSTITIGICLSLFYTWRMTLVSLVSVPLVIGSVVLEGRILANQDAIRQASDNANKLATEAISNIRTVASFCGEEATVERYSAACGAGKGAARKRLRWRGAVFSLGQTAPFAGYALSLYYGGILVANKELNYKEVIKVSEALIFGAWMMGQALAFAPNFGSALSAAGRIFTLLDRQPTIVSTKTPAVSDNFRANGKILYKSISFSYPMRPDAQILDGLTLEIPKGKRVALVGQSGCGKSTLIQLLQRLYDPLAGNVYLDDFNISTDMTLGTLRRQLGIVSQEPVLFNKSIAENIAYGDNTRNVRMDEIIAAAKEANIHGFVASLPRGYDTSLGAKGAQLSGGQKQRIAIARALVRNPRVLLLDEATSALDAQSEKLVQEALDKASEGRTCIIIAHRLTTVQQADVICVIDKGVVVEKGNHSELMEKNGMYAKLYELQYGFLSGSQDDA